MLKSTSLRKVILILIAFGGIAWSIRSADKIPQVPGPPGFLDGAGPSVKLRAIGLAGKPESATLLGVYFPTNTLMEILFKGIAPPGPFCKAYVTRHYTSVDEAKLGFQQAITNSAPPSNVRYNPTHPAIRKAIEGFGTASQESSTKTLGAAVVLGAIFHNDGTHASCRLEYLNWLDDASQKVTPYAISWGLLRVGQDQIDLLVAYPFRDSASVTSANQKLLGWIAAVRRQNPEPRP